MDEFRDIQNLLFLYLVGNDLSLKKQKQNQNDKNEIILILSLIN